MLQKPNDKLKMLRKKIQNSLLENVQIDQPARIREIRGERGRERESLTTSPTTAIRAEVAAMEARAALCLDKRREGGAERKESGGA